MCVHWEGVAETYNMNGGNWSILLDQTELEITKTKNLVNLNGLIKLYAVC